MPVKKIKSDVCPKCCWPYDSKMGGCEACREKRELINRLQEEKGDWYFNSEPGEDEDNYEPTLEEWRDYDAYMAKNNGGKPIDPNEERKKMRKLKSLAEKIKRQLRENKGQEGLPGIR